MLSIRYMAPLLAALAFPLAAPAQTLLGTAVDASSGDPIATAEVAVFRGAGEIVGLAVTDSAGSFRIRLAGPGLFRLVSNVLGYDSVSVDSLVLAADEVVTLELLFGPRPIAVEPVSVVARRRAATQLTQDFYFRLERHEKTGIGFVLDRTKLEEFRGQNMATALLHSTGIVQQTLASGPPRLIVKRRTATGISQGAYCDPAFFLDGLPIDEAAVRSIPATDLAGIEVYRGATQVPFAYLRRGAATNCGVILLWTRGV